MVRKIRRNLVRRGIVRAVLLARALALAPLLLPPLAFPALAFSALGCTTLPSRPAEEPAEVKLSSRRRGAEVRDDAPEISRSRGEQGGYVVLWPRVVPRDEDPTTREIASLLQARLRAIAERAAPGAPVDVRPSPERVCPRDGGCVGTSLGAVLSRKGEACAAAATVGAPGTSPVRIFGWAGTVEVKDGEVAFRDPPESQLVVREWAKCAELLEQLRTNQPPGEETAIERAAAGRARGAK